MKKEIKNIISGALLLFSSALFSQQDGLFTEYRYNMNIINPAYAGVDNETIITSAIRKQWVGIKDAPENQSLSFGTNLKKNVGIGATFVSDKTFIEKQVSLGIDFSYKVKLDETVDMYLGLKVGGNVYDVNTSGLETYNFISDPSLVNIHHFNPNIGVGMLIKKGKLFYSLSIPRILNTERIKAQSGIATVASDRPHLYMSAGYDFDLNAEKSYILKPSFLLRYVNGAPISFDINTLLKMHKYVEAGITYRTDTAQNTEGFFPMNTFAGMVNLFVNKNFTVGYVYEVAAQTSLASSRNTNEFLLKYKF
jgi:type IX secretion system PorP/SprF family membrane protein